MKIYREYKPHEVNWKLFPDILEKVRSAIPEDEKFKGGLGKGRELIEIPRFEISTFSQNVSLPSVAEFLSFLADSREKPEKVNILLECYMNLHDGDLLRNEPSYFEFFWQNERVFVQISRNTSANALRLLSDLEGLLQLTPAAPPKEEIEQHMLRRTVFIAHSFDDTGRSYAFQLTKVFSLLGFEVATGEGYSPESVSSKVRRRLAAQEMALAIISERDDNTWLIQETMAAEFSNKPLILLVEDGVDFKPGILGDVEYIKFSKGHISEAITPLLEGLRELGYKFA